MSLPLSIEDRRSSSISSSVFVIFLLTVVIPKLFAIDYVIGKLFKDESLSFNFPKATEFINLNSELSENILSE